MAASTVTIDTGEWVYVDKTGVEHTVTNAETFSMTVADGGTTAVEYSIPDTTQTVATDDGYNINLLPRVDGGNTAKTVHFLTDAGEGSVFHNIGGEIDMVCDATGDVQHWRIATITPSDADYGAAGTVAATFEDQYGNKMSWTAGMTVAQAA